MQIAPLQILSYRYKKERSVAFKIRQKIRFRPGLCPGLRWGSLQHFSDPIFGWRGDTPPQTSPHSTPTHLWHSPCVSPRILARSTCMHFTSCVFFHTYHCCFMLSWNLLNNFACFLHGYVLIFVKNME